MHTEAALRGSRDTSHFVQVTLELHQLTLLRLDYFGKICDFYLRLLLVLLVLRFHLEHVSLLVEKLIVRLTKYALHFIKFSAHICIFILKNRKIAH